jgi:hypothetical protein
VGRRRKDYVGYFTPGPPETQEKKAGGDIVDEPENAPEKNKEIKSLHKLRDRIEDIPSGCLLIHERAKLRKLKSVN